MKLPERRLYEGVHVSSEHLISSYMLGGWLKRVSKRRNSLVIRIVNHGHFSKKEFLHGAWKCFPSHSDPSKANDI